MKAEFATVSDYTELTVEITLRQLHDILLRTITHNGPMPLDHPMQLVYDRETKKVTHVAYCQEDLDENTCYTL
jgi:hypothetical protein